MEASVVTLGEIMLRLSPPNAQRIHQSHTLKSAYGGGEANVAVSCANFGMASYFVTKVPEHDIGEGALKVLKESDVLTPYVLRGGKRLGVYYYEQGVGMRPSKVIYDRKYSSITEAKALEFDLQTIMADKDWFHFSGITPALGEEALKLTQMAVEMAKKNGLMVSMDVNYRSKLWTQEEAAKATRQLMPYIDVFIGGREDALRVLNIEKDIAISKEEAFQKLMEAYRLTYIVSTNRVTHSASDHDWSALLYDGKAFHYSKAYKLRIIDRVGGGDSFAGALIYALCTHHTPEDALEFAVAASALKHSIQGDFNRVSKEEVYRLLNLHKGKESFEVY